MRKILFIVFGKHDFNLHNGLKFAMSLLRTLLIPLVLSIKHIEKKLQYFKDIWTDFNIFYLFIGGSSAEGIEIASKL